jgi:hypothetical protein
VTAAARVLLLHEPGAPEPALLDLAAALRERDAEVTLMACQEPYDAVLQVVQESERIVFWRGPPGQTS